MGLGNKPKAQECTNCCDAEFVLIDWYIVCLLQATILEIVSNWYLPALAVYLYIYTAESHIQSL